MGAAVLMDLLLILVALSPFLAWSPCRREDSGGIRPAEGEAPPVDPARRDCDSCPIPSAPFAKTAGGQSAFAAPDQ
jgi:hypothetical protein